MSITVNQCTTQVITNYETLMEFIDGLALNYPGTDGTYKLFNPSMVSGVIRWQGAIGDDWSPMPTSNTSETLYIGRLCGLLENANTYLITMRGTAILDIAAMSGYQWIDYPLIAFDNGSFQTAMYFEGWAVFIDMDL